MNYNMDEQQLNELRQAIVDELVLRKYLPKNLDPNYESEIQECVREVLDGYINYGSW